MKTENLDTQSTTFVPNAAVTGADYSAFKLTEAEYMKIKTVDPDPYRGQFKIFLAASGDDVGHSICVGPTSKGLSSVEAK